MPKEREQIPHSDASRHSDEHAQNAAQVTERSVHPTPNQERPTIEAFLENWTQSVLPPIGRDSFVESGWEPFWATTVGSDTPLSRIRLGYSYITKADLKPEFHYLFENDRTAQDAETIKVNEMVAMKIPSDLHFAAMSHFHHKEPLEFQKRTYSEVVQRALDERGNRVANLSDGYLDMEADMQRINARPNFSNR